jgi:hypothetical protein
MSDDAELDPLRVAFLVTHTFEALGVRYFIGGSLASIFHRLICTKPPARSRSRRMVYATRAFELKVEHGEVSRKPGLGTGSVSLLSSCLFHGF